MARLLAREGAPLARDKGGMTALMLAAFRGNVDPLRVLAQTGGLEELGPGGLTALGMAREAGHEEAVAFLESVELARRERAILGGQDVSRPAARPRGGL